MEKLSVQSVGSVGRVSYRLLASQAIALICAMAAGGSAAQYAAAAEPAARGMLEEVVVTARRREESLQDTPIAVSAFSAEALRERGIGNTSELTKIVPSLQISPGHSNQIYIRGVGQRTGFARVDPGVGVYLDDLYLPRTDDQMLDTVDVENIQVLRGPQGTLFGKNTTGGALVLTLAKPHDRREGYMEASAGNFSYYSGRAGMNLPLSERLFTRFALNVVRDDGFMKDIGTGDRANQNNRQSAIAQLRWNASDSVSLDALVFYGRIRERWPATNCKIASEEALFIRGLYLMWPGDTDPSNPRIYRENCEANSRERVGDLRYNLGDTNNAMDHSLDTLMLGATLDWEFSNSLSAKVVAGIRDSERGPIMTGDNDGGPLNFSEAYLPRGSDRRSYSLEVQLNGSAMNQRLQFTTGLFGMYEDNDEPFLLYTGIAGLDATTIAQLALGQPPEAPPPGGTQPWVGPLSGPIVDNQFDLFSTTYAAFFQASYDITEDVQLTVGVRHTREKRESRLAVIQADREAIGQRIAEHPCFLPANGGFNQSICPWALDPVGIAAAMFGDETGNGIVDFPMDLNNVQRDRREETFAETTPMVSLSWNLPERWLSPAAIDSTLLYATWSTGFKSGFFEPRVADGLQRVEPERVENREIGFKVDAMQRSLRLNVSLYSMIFENMQLIQVQRDSMGNNAVVFANAGESKIEGGELELTWLPTAAIMINLAYSHNRYRFTEFTDRDFFAQALEGRIVDVDRTDEGFIGTPEQSFSMGVQYHWDSGIGSFTPRLDYSYKSDNFLGLDRGSWLVYKQDKRFGGQPAYSLVDFRLSWLNPGGDLSAALYIKNLADKRYSIGTAAVADSVATFNELYGDPRRYGIELRKTF